MSIEFKIPEESTDYPAHSAFVIEQITSIIKDAVENGRNRIFIHTNLKRGLPLENINKVAGPFVEAWEFCQMLDTKFIHSKGEDAWLKMATKYQWIKTE